MKRTTSTSFGLLALGLFAACTSDMNSSEPVGPTIDAIDPQQETPSADTCMLRPGAGHDCITRYWNGVVEREQDAHPVWASMLAHAISAEPTSEPGPMTANSELCGGGDASALDEPKINEFLTGRGINMDSQGDVVPLAFDTTQEIVFDDPRFKEAFPDGKAVIHAVGRLDPDDVGKPRTEKRHYAMKLTLSSRFDPQRANVSIDAPESPVRSELQLFGNDPEFLAQVLAVVKPFDIAVECDYSGAWIDED
jgi:hypothetical protein